MSFENPEDAVGRDGLLIPSALMAVVNDETPDDPDEYLETLVEGAADYSLTVARLMRGGFLPKQRNCNTCGRNMRLRKNKGDYKWLCRRTENKRTFDCSTVAIRNDSWFQGCRMDFKVLLPFLIMHAKMSSDDHIQRTLDISPKTIDDGRRMVGILTAKIVADYPKLSGVVRVESLTLEDQDGDLFDIFAGVQDGSVLCFAECGLPNVLGSRASRLQRILTEKTDNAKIVRVQTKNANLTGTPFFKEKEHYADRHMRFFSNLRRDAKKTTFPDSDALRDWLNDQVVRRVEGLGFLDTCVESITQNFF